MTKKVMKKSFDALEYKRQVQEEIYEETKDMTAPELIAYFRDRAISGPFAELREKLQAQQSQRKAADLAPAQMQE